MLVADSGDSSASGIGGFLVSCSLAIIVPTLNEAGNIRPLLDRLEAALSGIAYEVIFVDDDSSDDTPVAARPLGSVGERGRGCSGSISAVALPRRTPAV
jgi:Glycosyl transferase family 2